MRNTKAQFFTPRELLDQFVKETSNIPSGTLFRDPAYQKQRERWIAAQLGLGLGKMGIDVLIRPNDEQKDETDFELKLDGILRFQATEVQKPGRKRGDDYKARAEKPLRPEPYEPQRGMQEGPDWIASAIEKKAKKHYASKPHLIVYANFDADDLDKKAIVRKCQPYEGKFLSLWILQNHRVVQLWQCEELRGYASDWVYLPDIWQVSQPLLRADH